MIRVSARKGKMILSSTLTDERTAARVYARALLQVRNYNDVFQPTIDANFAIASLKPSFARSIANSSNNRILRFEVVGE